MSYQVRWYASNDNLSKTVQVNEGNGWISYRQSVNYEPDAKSVMGMTIAPSGFRTFQNCLKKGYEVQQSVQVKLIKDGLGNVDKVSGIMAELFYMIRPEAQELVEYVVEHGECVVYRGTPEQCETWVNYSKQERPEDERFTLVI